MKRILFRFPLKYYLNPINLIGIAFMTFLQYSKWVSLFAEIAEYERNNVTHWHNHFELIPSTIIMIGWTVLNVLLYPYVYDAILRFTAKYLKKSLLMRGLWSSTVSVYQAEKARGNLFKGYKTERNAGGWITNLVPEFDNAGSRAFDVASNHFIFSLIFPLFSYYLLFLLLWGGWMLSAVIGWIFALAFDKENRY